MQTNDNNYERNGQKRLRKETSFLVAIHMLAILRSGKRMGTQEVMARLQQDYGIKLSLRHVQRTMKLLSEVLPIRCDGGVFRGYWWDSGQYADDLRLTVTAASKDAVMMQEAA